MNTRALAALVITDVFTDGKSLTEALAERQNQLSSGKDRALLQELSFGVTRWWWQLDSVLTFLLDKPLKPKDSDLKHLAMVGLYQLANLRIPDHAAVAETVNACKDLEKVWAKKLLNALLRNYQRKADTIAKSLSEKTEYQYSHPQWLYEKIKKSWPSHWQSIMEANNQKPPMVIRVNALQKSRDEYLEILASQEIAASQFSLNDVGVVIENPLPVEELPGFEQGWFSVQDGAAQLAAGLLGLDSAHRVLDVCASPGGKTAHILETARHIDSLTAVDVDNSRLTKVTENLQRLGLKAKAIAGDARSPDQWWDRKPYDRILLDAPCSATGVIRRHPDIKRLRRPSDISELVDVQADILNAVWPLLSSGGILLYATCSILPEENDLQVGNFLKSHPQAKSLSHNYSWGLKQAHGDQILPGQNDMDGFYYACLQKQ